MSCYLGFDATLFCNLSVVFPFSTSLFVLRTTRFIARVIFYLTVFMIDRMRNGFWTDVLCVLSGVLLTRFYAALFGTLSVVFSVVASRSILHTG